MKFLTDLALRKKIALLTLVGLVLGIGISSFLGIRAVNQATEAMLEERMTTARLVASYLDEALGHALDVLKNTVQTAEVDRVNDKLQDRIDTLKETYSRLSIYPHSIYFLDNQGQIIWCEPANPTLVGRDVSVYVNQNLRADRASVSGLVSAPCNHAPVVLLTCPTQGEEKSSLVVAIDPAQSSIGGFIQPIRLGQTGYVEIVDQNGVVVARTEPGPKLAPFERSDHSGRFAALIAAGKPTRGLCHTCHEPIQRVERKDIIAFVPLSSVSWGVVIRQAEEEALAPIRELQQNLLLFGAGLATLTLIFVAIITRDVVRRISFLTAASQRIAEGDLTHPITVSRKDEVGILAQTIEGMRSKLGSSYGELEQRTRELSSLLSVSEVLSRLPDLSNLDTALGSALDKALQIIKVDIGGILLFDAEKEMLCYRVHRGFSEQYVQGVCCRLGEGIAGRVAQTGQAILVEDISVDSRAAHPNLISMEGLRSFASVPISYKGKVLGVLNIASREAHKFSPENVRLLESIAGQIAVAIENAKLHQEVRRKEEIRGELLRDMFSIQEEERKRIARELHDETSQVLASLAANLEAAVGLLPLSADKIKTILRNSQALSVNMLDEIHKIIYELRPSLLDDLGLVAATHWLLDNNLGASGVKVSFKTTGRKRRLPTPVETTVFRVIQEAVYNIAKHARAKHAGITLRFERNRITVNIWDDGKGFDVNEAIGARDRPRGLGLLGMKERIGLLNGVLDIKSQPGRGTEINIVIPL